MESIERNAPWLKNYGDVPFHLEYPRGSISRVVLDTASKYPDFPALTYMDKQYSYKTLSERIDLCARAFTALGVSEGRRVTICMPNVPQTVFCFYALNRIGAVASMVHPLSAVGEIVFYLREAESDFVVTLDQFYDKIALVQKETEIKNILITGAADELGFVKRNGYKLTKAGRSIPKIPHVGCITHWDEFLKLGKASAAHIVEQGADDTAAILFSGGTTGVTKGIALSNLNFNSLALQTAAMAHSKIQGSSMLAAMPMFHGFGLGVCIHTMMVAGGTSILVPRFNVKEYAELIKKNRPNYIAGVPTLFEAITRNPYLDGVTLDHLMGVFSGGDSLSIELKHRFDNYLHEHGATIKVREGYGTTECVTASCLTPYHTEKDGSIGFPYPDTYYKICAVGTCDEVPLGTEGEICLSGPSVMKGYLNKPEENANTLRRHWDGRIWLHTGDLGFMDEDGFIYFRQRIKRMIVTSGYNVYPSQLENIIDAHPAVQMSCVIGVKDDYKMEKVKAFVVLKSGIQPSEKLRGDIMDHCKKQIAKYALPYDIEFREELPKTLVGKIAYTVLEKEENARLAAQGK